MIYHVNIFKVLFSIDYHLARIQAAEHTKNIWKNTVFLLLLSVFVYAWSASFGLGSQLLSRQAAELSSMDYELTKFWFMIGRACFGVLFSVVILFVPSLFFYVITGIAYQKLLIMQQVVLLVMLIERVLWIPIGLIAGLDWDGTPFSFGIIMSYLTNKSWLITLFGTITIFQVWIIWFQVKFMDKTGAVEKRWLWVSVIGWAVLGFWFVTLLSYIDGSIIGRWFG